MREKRKIVDTTLRDGEQCAKVAFRMRDKIEIALLLDQLKVHEIEAGIFMDGLDGREYFEELMDKRTYSQISVWSRMKKSDVEKAISCKPDLIHIGTPVSYVHIYNKLKKNKTWVLKQVHECADIALNAGIGVTVGFEDASRADIGFMIGLAKSLKERGVSIIRIADTVGILTPGRTSDIIRQIKNQVDIGLEIHAHNDLGMAVANSVTAIKSGAEYIDCTISGLGERSGNCNLYEFVHAAERFFDIEISKSGIKQAENKLHDIIMQVGLIK